MRILCLLFFLSAKFLLSAQGYIHIDRITVEGNKKTKDEIILRELRFSAGDSIPVRALDTLIRESEQLIMNTSLFNGASISIYPCETCPPNNVIVYVLVEEAWYLYPVPIFELADRNFNVWWVEQNRSLQRINFGSEFAHTNFTGRMDRLKVGAKYGYTHNYSLKYSLPYINKKQTLGISADISYSKNREVNYATDGNKQLFYRDSNDFVYNAFRSVAGVTYRPGLRAFHNFYLGFYQNHLSDFVAGELNPEFFLNGHDTQRYFSFTYEFTYDERDIRPYPLSGRYISLRLEKDGLGIYNDRNSMTLFAYYDQYFPFSQKLSLALKTGGKASLIRTQQPYNDNRAVGFGRNHLHGYEYYIVDGLDMGFVKTNLRFQVMKEELNFGKFVPINQFRKMPVKLYFSVNSDWGYVNEPFANGNNFLVNQLLWGYGVGLDFVFFYDKVFRIEYSFNHLMEKGIFLNMNLNI